MVGPNKLAIRVILAAAVLASGAACPARAFTLLYSASADLTTIGWKTNSVTFDIDTSCTSFMDDVNSSIGQAQDLWNHVPSSGLVLSIGGSVTLPKTITTYVGTSATSAAPVGNPIVYCDTNFGTDSGEPADQIPGFASSQNLLSSGQLQGGLLVLNFQTGAAANIHTLGASVASIVLAHEMGHVLGLGHSSDADALMYYATGTTRKLILAQDDINGISYLYPRQEPGQGGLFGCASLSAVGGGAGGRSAGRRSRPGSEPLKGAAEFGILALFAAVVVRARWIR